MGDAVRRSFAALATSPPNTTLSQNNGIVALTRCASTHAGYACGFRLLIFRMIATVGAWILSIPDFVLGGALTFLFANVRVLCGVRCLLLVKSSRFFRISFLIL
uniref:Uncharacterized protein n=1 Tax=Grammatophora oceanica TaxID=210454 RepID=A0A7S1VE57_9STRA|mmetsp:Transcript_42782/g.63461  ORF Transcript_42782/g.63461 Transcript_42782/m.63461 type:complete len:104 (+) Transcript_42782:454-765(+)